MLDVVKPQFHNEQLRDQLEALGRRWRSFFPLSDEAQLAQKSYDEDFLVRMAYNSNAIEGSTLTLAETEIIYEGEFVAGKPGREQVAAKGIFEANEFMEDAFAAGVPFDQDLILDLHARCALDLQPRARGIYRSTPAIIRASRTAPIAAHKIRTAMDDLLFHYGDMLQNEGPLLAIPWFHAVFERIHPFADGNGRTGRLLMNYQLEVSGYPPIAIKVDNSAQYKSALEDWQVEGDSSPFMSLFASCLKEELAKRVGFLEACGSANRTVRSESASRRQQVLGLIAADGTMTAAAIGKELGISQRQVQRIIGVLKAEGTLERHGSNKSGFWEVRES